jgi:hypothetical protein
MTQRRIKDYGTLAEASDLKQMLYALARSSVLQGLRFGVAGTSKMRVLPGTAVTHEGTMIIEDEPLEIDVPVTSNPQDYTVYYEHIDQDISGGEPAILRLGNGILNPNDIKGVVLGYVRYPGSAVPMSTAFFEQEPERNLKNYIPNRQNADWVIPLKGNGYLVTATSGSSLTITDFWDTVNNQYSLKLQNNVNSPSLATAIFTLPFKVGSTPFALFQAKMQVDLGATVEFKMIDSLGDLIDITAIPLDAQADFFLYSLSIPTQASQNPNDIIYLQMIVNISYTRMVKIQGIGLSQYNLPI